MSFMTCFSDPIWSCSICAYICCRSPIRSSIVAIDNDISTIRKYQRHTRRDSTKLEDILKKQGGAYKTSGFDSLFFYVYTNIEFSPVKAERRDLTVGLILDAPPGDARDSDANKRYTYWKHCRRLGGGSLVALVIVSPGGLQVFLGTITSFSDDIAESSKASPDRIQVRVAFFDHLVEFMALKHEKLSKGKGHYAFLVDNSVLFEASRPFLERLQTVEPTELPFARYISCSGSLKDIQVLLPRYATAPQFKYKLGCLFKEERPINDVDIRDPNAVEVARQHLLRQSCLDPSQVEAMVNTLTREVSLIQGYVAPYF